MMNVAVRFQEKTEKQQVPAGTRLKDLLQMGVHGSRVIAARVDGRPVDLSVSVNGDCMIEWVEIDSPEGVDILRHSTSHLMAQAVKSLFPKAQVTIGPTIEEGFYYDFAYPGTFAPEDLQKIEEKMRSLISANLTLERIEMPRARAITFFEEMGETYKAEIIRGLEEEVVSLYRQGDFIDLCRGPHVPSTGVIPAFKLLSVAGAYWRGDERNAMLQRIYGTAFPTQEALDQYLHKLEEIKRRDHRKIGKELDLFSVQEGIGAGLILWHPKGALIRRLMEDFWKDEHLKSGYELLYTPHVAKIDLWHTSGHTAFYRENMYSPIRVEETDFQLKPMNCPFHIMVYQTHLRSYRDLPIRWAELGTVYRYERSGVLHGLMRVRGFTQDDAHIFCRPDQLHAEIVKILDLTVFVLKTFGFEKYDIFLSTRPEKYVGSLEDWDRATEALRSALEQKGLAYQEDPGEGVFYGPKIDIKIKDVLDRSWQCSTVQVDFNLPARFELSYAGEDGQTHRPIMIHRALMGSLERFFGVLIEHYAGAFPFWLAPVQVRVLPITDQQQVYVEEIRKALMEEGFRVECDLRNEKLGYKIREAQLQKIPYMLVVGKKEVESHTVSVRKRSGEDLGGMEISRLIPVLREEMKTIKAEGGETVSKSN